MKRNCPPDRLADEIAEERQIIEDRLSELYPTDQTALRKIFITKKGHYVHDLHHVRLDSSVKLHPFEGLVQYCSKLNYHYLGPYQALYMLENRHLIIYLNELPLSLAEAYKLLLRDVDDFTNYGVFCYLNRSAFYCYPPENPDPKGCSADVSAMSQPDEDSVMTISNSSDPTKPLFKIDKLHSATYEEVLDGLSKLGPKDLNVSKVTHEVDELIVTFDIYKRETFNKNKPRRGKPGSPDYFVVVCDGKQPNSPSGAQMANFSLKYGAEARGKLLFAIVDSDSTMSFAHFNPTHPSDLQVDHNAWPEQISVSEMPAANYL